ncbi:phage tail spike protein [Oceanobacillus kimchii]|uniref:phage tail spike protein n=1 Tax=Oceanobacillus kimchii TaxID=746691 RepID=UPI003B0212F8
MIHITDGQSDKMLSYITEKKFNADIHRQSLPDTLETFQFETFVDEAYSEHLSKRNRVIIPAEDAGYREFIIYETIKFESSSGLYMEVYADASYLELKKARVIEPQTFSKQTPSTVVSRATNETEWRPGIIEGDGYRTFHIEKHTNPYSFLRTIATEFDLELRFRTEVNGNRVVGRYVDLLERLGKWRGREITFGKDLISIKRIEKNDVVTALVGLAPEKEDGTRLEVLVEDVDALQRWGREDPLTGELQHLIETYEPQSEQTDMTEEELTRYTRTELNKRINGSVEYETDIADLENVPGLENKKIRFGDTIKLKDTKFNPPLYVEARVHTQERSIKDKSKKKVVLGDYIEYTEEQIQSIWQQMQAEIRRRLARMLITNIASTAGDTFKNGIGETELTAEVFLSGDIVDENGELYTYIWNKRDKNGIPVSGWNKSGKTIIVSANEIDEKATFTVDVVQETVLSIGRLTITNVFDGEDGKEGPAGPKGEDGPQGIAGPPGEDGKSLYTWVKYADSPTSGMSDSPNGKKYIGIAYNKSTPTKSNSYSDYEWAKTEGNQGVPGEPGKDGTPRYTWVKYANDENGNGMSDSAQGKRYLGLAHNKTTASESSNPSDYSWSPLYDNVKVGGVNLISGSATPLNYGVASSSHDYKRVYLNLERNTTYTFSSKVEVIQGDVTEITVYPYKQSGQNMNTMHLPIIDGKIEGTFTTDDRYDYDLLVYNGRSGNTTGNHIKLIERQLERGNIPSDYDRAPEDVDQAIDKAEDSAKGHADTVSEAAYIDAINDAEDYMEANGIMQGAKYNGVSITNQDGFVTARGDGLVRTVMNSTLGYVVQRRSSKSAPWENVLFFDTNGNARFAGTITADSTIDVETDATIGGYLTVGKNIIDRYVGITFGDGDENASISTQVTPEGNSNGLDFYADYVNIAKPGGRFMADEFRTRDGVVDAIVSQGSNANGEFVRYESGLQLCWAQPFAQATNSRYSDTSITTSSTDYWTYPADFDDDYPIAVSGVCSSLSRIVGTTGSTSNGSAPIRTYSLSGAYTNTAYSVYTMAIGRWK